MVGLRPLSKNRNISGIIILSSKIYILNCEPHSLIFPFYQMTIKKF